MALGSCTDCSHPLSPRADSCPKCGRLLAFETFRLVVRVIFSVIIFMSLVYP